MAKFIIEGTPEEIKDILASIMIDDDIGCDCSGCCEDCECGYDDEKDHQDPFKLFKDKYLHEIPVHPRYKLILSEYPNEIFLYPTLEKLIIDLEPLLICINTNFVVHDIIEDTVVTDVVKNLLKNL